MRPVRATGVVRPLLALVLVVVASVVLVPPVGAELGARTATGPADAAPQLAPGVPPIAVDPAHTFLATSSPNVPNGEWYDTGAYHVGTTVSVSTAEPCKDGDDHPLNYNWWVYVIVAAPTPSGIAYIDVPGASKVTSAHNLDLRMPAESDFNPDDRVPVPNWIHIAEECTAAAAGSPFQRGWYNNLRLYDTDIGGIGGSAPVAAFTKAPSPTDPFAWNFDGSSSTGSPTSYSWDFGDDKTAVGPSSTVQHTYLTQGRYTVKLTVANPYGVSSITDTVDVPSSAVIVNTTDDDANQAPSSHTCDTGKPKVGEKPACSMRAAIQVIDHGGGATIGFAIPGGGVHVISPSSALPDVSSAVSIDATTQPSGSVMLDGSGAGSDVDGLTITGGGSTVRGFTISNFGGAGVKLAGSSGSTVAGNWLGTTADGTHAAPNASGVNIDGSASNTVGGSGADANVIVATRFGVGVAASSGAAPANQVSGNHIGTDAAGSGLLVGASPGSLGVLVLGTADHAASAAISNNTINGVSYAVEVAGSGAGGSSVVGNKIGTDASGLTALGGPGANGGIRDDGVPSMTISGNVVAGPFWGISIAGSPQISGSEDAIFLLPPSETATGTPTETSATVTGNLVGVLGDGQTLADPATHGGVAVWAGASGVTLSANTITGSADGVVLWGGGGHVVTGNHLGVSADGSQAFASSGAALEVLGTSGAQIGGPGIDDGNVIGGANHGLSVGALVSARATGTVVGRNAVGVSAAGTAVPNTLGVDIEDATGTTLTDNTISSNTVLGLQIGDGARTTSLRGNRVGLAPTTDGVAANGAGIAIGRATDTDVGLGNVVSGNTGVGLSSSGTRTKVTDSRFGVGAASNVSHGNSIAIRVLRGDADIEGNIIANSSDAGVVVDAGATATILHNPTYANDGIGIAAPSAPAPHPPTLVDAVRVTHGKSVRTWLVVKGLPVAGGRLEAFANPSCADPEGKTPLLTKSVDGLTQTALTLIGRPELTAFTVTFTDAIGHTSAFSSCRPPDGAAPDGDDDGVPDAVEAVSPYDDTAADPAYTSFPSDAGDWITVHPSDGTLHAVSPVDNPSPETLPAGVTLPQGQIAFTVTGLTPGASATVQIICSPGVDVSGDYWRYGPPTPHAAPSWYAWNYDSSHTGAEGDVVVDHNGTLYPSYQLNFIDGQRGDDDSAADGTIVDPGGPAPGPATPPTTTTTVAPSTSISTSTSVPVTSGPGNGSTTSTIDTATTTAAGPGSSGSGSGSTTPAVGGSGDSASSSGPSGSVASSTASSGTLARTGVESLPLVWLGSLLVVTGAVVLSRRRVLAIAGR